jgi:hypothetical protein
MLDATILLIVSVAIAGLADPSRKIRELRGCLEEPNGDGCAYARKVTPICDNKPAARWVKVVLTLSNPTLFCVIYHGQQADSTDGAQTPMHGGCSFLPLADIFPPPAEEVINDIREESDNDGEMRCPKS